MVARSELDLTTEVPDPIPFTVDGESFKMFTYEHLSKDAEAHVQALFRRHVRETRRLAESKTDAEAERAASNNRVTRIEILCAMTDLPDDVAERLPASQQAKLMKAIAGAVAALSAEVEDE